MILIFYLHLEYAFAEIGGSCLSIGKSPILNKESCQNAVQFVKENGYPRIPRRVETHTEYAFPRGCYVHRNYHKHNDNGVVYFNDHSTGHKDVYSRQICNGVGMLTRGLSFKE